MESARDDYARRGLAGRPQGGEHAELHRGTGGDRHGGSKGIGKGIARVFASKGANVMIAARGKLEIKAGKAAMKWMRMSCQSMVANAVWL
jgi:hypothetical protein